MLNVDGVEGQHHLLLRLATTQTDFQLVDVALQTLGGLFHPNLREFSVLKGDGLYLLDIVQSCERHLIARQLTLDPHVALVHLEVFREIPVGDDLLHQGECTLAVCVTSLAHYQQIVLPWVQQTIDVHLCNEVTLAGRAAAVEHKVSVPVVQERKVHIVEYLLR